MNNTPEENKERKLLKAYGKFSEKEKCRHFVQKAISNVGE